MPAQVHYKPQDVDQQLAALDLTVAILHDVGRAAQLARTSCSPNDPPILPGILGWGHANRKLRDLVLPTGKWRKADPGNYSMTINDERRSYVVVAAGDELTGRLSELDPGTRNPKGTRTVNAVQSNRQLELFPWTVPDEAKATHDTAFYNAWLLLIDAGVDKIYMELSRPTQMDGTQIVDWAVRIILPPIDLAPLGGEPPQGFTPDFDADVSRKS